MFVYVIYVISYVRYLLNPSEKLFCRPFLMTYGQKTVDDLLFFSSTNFCLFLIPSCTKMSDKFFID